METERKRKGGNKGAVGEGRGNTELTVSGKGGWSSLEMLSNADMGPILR